MADIFFCYCVGGRH